MMGRRSANTGRDDRQCRGPDEEEKHTHPRCLPSVQRLSPAFPSPGGEACVWEAPSADARPREPT